MPTPHLDIAITRYDHTRALFDGSITFDGRDLFKSFFFVPPEKQGDKDRPGLDLRAEFETVIGFFETSARGVSLSMQKRANKLNVLDMHASLAGGTVAVVSRCGCAGGA